MRVRERERLFHISSLLEVDVPPIGVQSIFTFYSRLQRILFPRESNFVRLLFDRSNFVRLSSEYPFLIICFFKIEWFHNFILVFLSSHSSSRHLDIWINLNELPTLGLALCLCSLRTVILSPSTDFGKVELFPFKILLLLLPRR